ncbi:bifunctional epoxide hydrolase 2-like [Dysidea avara]|uniref:bifunctional epoxide hydrolase 2-like n=1 Tax=Dysidea avara TaxID=196820 RepID=UPI0033278626
MKAVLFDLGGVLISAPQLVIARYEKSLGLPSGGLTVAFVRGAPNNAFCRLETGELTLSEFAPLFEKECQLATGQLGIQLPSSFSARTLFENIRAASAVNQRMFQAASKLKQNGYLIGILTNNWIDESDETRAEFMSLLNQHFHVVVESCKEGVRKPDKAAFRIACERLKTDPQDVIFLDDLGVNVKAARQMGMHTILVRDTQTALQQLSDLTGVDVHSDKQTSKL